MTVRIENASKRFGTFAALHGVSLDVQPREFLALLGPSGSGKTTLLRMIAGLDFPDAGRVLLDGIDMTGTAAAERRIGFVFQNYALFRHMTIAANIGFGLSVRKRRDRPSRAEIARRVEELLTLVQLPGLGRRYPAQLSGGQRQRVALARALAVEPRLLLLDEPFGALDAKVRKDLRGWLRDLHDRMGLTSVFVTHDQEEALELADRIVVMRGGAIEQIGTPREVYDHPATSFVSDFIGETNKVPVVISGGRVRHGETTIDCVARDLRDGPGELHFRPHQARLTTEIDNTLPIRVNGVRWRGNSCRIEASVTDDATPVEIDLAIGEPMPEAGALWRLRLTNPHIFPSQA